MPKLNSVNVLPLLCCFILTNGLKWLGETETVLRWDKECGAGVKEDDSEVYFTY